MMEFGVDSKTQPGSLVTFRSRNIGDTRIYGMEVTVAGQGNIGDFPATLLLGYNYIKPEFINFEDSLVQANTATSYNVLKYRFRHTFVGDFGIRIHNLELGVAGRYFSYMENIDLIFEILLPGIADFRLRKLKDPDELPSEWGPRSF